MDEFHRRALLGVAGIGAVAALGSMAKAGPLTPPAGGVAPTGRTLDEVYNRIPASFPAADRTPFALPPGGGPYTISAPGSYLLTAGGAVAGAALIINADGVTVDLNGYTLASTAATGNVVTIGTGGPRNNITIRNGTLAGAGYGLSVFPGTAVSGVLFEGLRLDRQRLAGVFVNSLGTRNIVARGCHVSDVGAGSVAADSGLPIAGIALGGQCCRIEECTVSRFVYNGAGTPTFRGIWINATGANGAGNLIARCMVAHETALTATGVQFTGSGVYRDNTVMNLSTPYAGGTNGGGNI